MLKPQIDAASPEKEFSKEIVIGISAPPTRIANNTPNANATTKETKVTIITVV